MNDNKIKFSRVRDFSDTISDTFSFLRNELKPLLKTVLVYVGPVILITGFFSAWYQAGVVRHSINWASDSDIDDIFKMYSQMFDFRYFLMMLGSTVSSILLMLVIMGYITLYESRGSGNFESSEVWDMIKDKIFPVFLSYIFLGVIFVLITAIIGVLAYAISPAVAIFLGIVYLFALIYFMIAISLYIPDMVFKGASFFSAFKRSLFLVRNYWWTTLGVLFISSMIASIGQAIFVLPQSLLNIATVYTSATGGESSSVSASLFATIFTVVGTFASYLLYAIPFTAIAVHYFSQVERKENSDLINRIDQIENEN